MKKKILLYTRFERFWHWCQAILILGLMVTGFEIHGTFRLTGFENAFLWHNYLSYALIALSMFAIFWHFTTGEWKQYIPTMEKIGEMVCYYTKDIFKGKPHPFEKRPDRKLNPLQRITYFLLKVVIFPFQIGTGLVYLYNDELAQAGINLSTRTIAYLHTAGGFMFLVFLVIHVYLATTGPTVFSHMKAIITGWELIEDDLSA